MPRIHKLLRRSLLRRGPGVVLGSACGSDRPVAPTRKSTERLARVSCASPLRPLPPCPLPLADVLQRDVLLWPRLRHKHLLRRGPVLVSVCALAGGPGWLLLQFWDLTRLESSALPPLQPARLAYRSGGMGYGFGYNTPWAGMAPSTSGALTHWAGAPMCCTPGMPGC